MFSSWEMKARMCTVKYNPPPPPPHLPWTEYNICWKEGLGCNRLVHQHQKGWVGGGGGGRSVGMQAGKVVVVVGGGGGNIISWAYA